MIDEKNSYVYDSEVYPMVLNEFSKSDSPRSQYKRWIIKLRLTDLLKRSFYMRNQAEALELVESINKVVKAATN